MRRLATNAESPSGASGPYGGPYGGPHGAHGAYGAVKLAAGRLRQGGVAPALLRLVLAAFVIGPILWYLAADHELKNGAAARRLLLEGEVAQILVVNMDGQEALFEQLVRHVRQVRSLVTVPIVRVPGVNASQLDLHTLVHQGQLSREGYGSVIQTRPVHGHHLTLGAIGCYLAHTNAWTAVAESGRTTLILEEDVRLRLGADPSHFFGKLVQRVLPAADLIYLGNIIGEAVAENLHEYDPFFWRMVGGHYGTYAYIVHPRAARVLLQHAFPITHQVDSNIIETAVANRLRVYNSHTTFVVVDNSPTRATRVQRYTQPDLLIPRTIHVSWFNSTAGTAQLSATAARWTSVNPGWVLRVWTDHDDLPSSFAYAYANEAFASVHEKLDVARYHILEHYGGVFVDVDCLPLRPIDEILRGVSAFVAYEDDVNLADTPIGAVPHHPFLRRVLAELPARRQEMPLNGSRTVRTGSGFLRDMATLYRLYHSDLTMFSDQVFFPVYAGELDPGPPYGHLHYAAHKYGGL